MKLWRILFWWLLIVNVVTFCMYGLDKLKAKKGKRRIPEKTLMWSAAVGGSIGAICGMFLFRHKTLHKKFRIGLPAILIAQLLLAGFILWKTGKITL